jgi:hypothetical protein
MKMAPSKPAKSFTPFGMPWWFLPVVFVFAGSIIGFPLYDTHRRLQERGDSTCYANMKSYFELMPEIRLRIMKYKADGLFTREECNGLNDVVLDRYNRKGQLEDDAVLNSIGTN